MYDCIRIVAAIRTAFAGAYNCLLFIVYDGNNGTALLTYYIPNSCFSLVYGFLIAQLDSRIFLTPGLIF